MPRNLDQRVSIMTAQSTAHDADATVARSQWGGLAPPLDEARRRSMWSFLTWAFFLSETFKAQLADAHAGLPTEDPDDRQLPPQGDAPGPGSLAGDEPVLRDWSFSFPSNAVPESLGAGPFQLQLPSVHGDAIDEAGTARITPAGAVGSASGAATAEASGPPAFQDLADQSDLALTLGRPDTHVELHPSLIGLDLGGLGLPLLGQAGETVSDLLAPVAELADGAVDTVGSLLCGLTGGLASGGSLLFGAPPIQTDALFLDGRYTDYNITLQIEHGLGSITDIIGSEIPDAADLPSDQAAVHLASADHGAGSNLIAAQTVLEDLLRNPVDHLL